MGSLHSTRRGRGFSSIAGWLGALLSVMPLPDKRGPYRDSGRRYGEQDKSGG